MIWNGSPGSARKIATARVATMTLPPPTAISRSAAHSRAACVALRTEAKVEILLDAVIHAGIAVAEDSFDAPDDVGAPVDGSGADHEGPLRARPFHRLKQVLLDDLPAAVIAATRSPPRETYFHSLDRPYALVAARRSLQVHLREATGKVQAGAIG